MVDRDRVLAKLDELESYLGELRAVAPDQFEAYQRTETKRACERLIQVSVEAVIDICALLVVGLRLGLPGEEDDLFERLSGHGAISSPMTATLRCMKGRRNLLVHEYGRINERSCSRRSAGASGLRRLQGRGTRLPEEIAPRQGDHESPRVRLSIAGHP